MKSKIVIAGASGLVGRALVPALRAEGHEVCRLVRGRAARGPDEIPWDPAAGTIDRERLSGTGAIINLAGENIAAHRWTEARRTQILRSRVEATRTLVAALGAIEPRPRVLLNASAIGYYGDRGDDVLTEASSIGHGFLPEVCLAWETHAEGAARLGVRTVRLRFGVVLAREDGALAKMLPLFRLGLGGRMGSGRQWMSWIALDDVVGSIRHALADEGCAGPLNVTAPQPVTNAEFAATLGRVLRRPAILPVPALALRAAVGNGIAHEALLASQRALPARLQEGGYAFRYPALDAALRAVLAR